MIVYRLEDAKGFGPWSSNLCGPGSPGEWILTSLGKFPEWLPSQDFPPEDSPDENVLDGYKYGCLTVEQLREWFPNLDQIVETGLFSVVAHDIPDSEAHIGYHQVAYWALEEIDKGLYDQGAGYCGTAQVDNRYENHHER